MKVKVAQSCWTLCDSMDYTVHGILQARILEWIAIPFSRGPSQPRDWTQVSCIAGGFLTSWATREAQEPSMYAPLNELLTILWVVPVQILFTAVCILLYDHVRIDLSILPLMDTEIASKLGQLWTTRLWAFSCLGHTRAHFSREHTQDTGLELLNLGGVGIFYLMVHHFL